MVVIFGTELAYLLFDLQRSFNDLATPFSKKGLA